MSCLSAALEASAPERLEAVRPERFKDTLARLASGVAIVACWDGDEPAGLLVSSLTGLSVDPPRFLFCVRKEASAHTALTGATFASLAILSADQREHALKFGSKAMTAQRFRGVGWRFEVDAPRLSGGLASMVGRLEPAFDAGEHTVFIFTAERIEEQDGAEPLIYVDRSFSGAVPLP